MFLLRSSSNDNVFLDKTYKTEHLGNATMKYLLAAQATGRNNAGEFSAEEKNNKTKLCLPLYVFKTPIHVEGSTQKVLPC